MKVKGNAGRKVGFIYLLLILSGVFAELVIRTKIIVAGDAAATAVNILKYESLFRISMVSDLFMMMCYFFLGLLMYNLLKHINKNIAKIMLALNLIGVPIMVINLIHQWAAFLILNGDLGTAFDTEQIQALAMLFINLHKYGYLIATVSYGLWLCPMGYLIIKSNQIPKIIGMILMTASVSYTIYLILSFMGGESIALFFTIPATIGEISMCLYLLIKGYKQEIITQ